MSRLHSMRATLSACFVVSESRNVRVSRCDLKDVLSARRNHNLSHAPLERLIQDREKGVGTNDIAAYVRLWSHLRTIKRPLVQMCKLSVKIAALALVFRIHGLVYGLMDPFGDAYCALENASGSWTTRESICSDQSHSFSFPG